jgi:hypothetical protein
MSQEQDGPNLWWQFLEFMGMTWPGKLKQQKQDQIPKKIGKCQACQNVAKYDSKQDRFYCANHPSAQIKFEE